MPIIILLLFFFRAQRSLGYKVAEDGTVETQDKFLRRMSGLMRLYAAIMVTTPPQGANTPHPHGLLYAWRWLARVMNLDPNPDITATAIYDMLQVGERLN
jgi:nucleoporin GLE1